MIESLTLLVVFFALIALGVPIAYSMGLSTVTALIVLDVPVVQFLTRSVANLSSFSLLAIPFYIVAGEILTAGGMSNRLIEFAHAVFGWLRGGLAVVNVGSSILFAGVSGSSTADTVAVGGVLIPAMKKEGYDPSFAAAVTAASSTLGPIIPPSVLLILYGGVTGLSISSLFLAGVVPGVVIGASLMVFAWWRGRQQVDTTWPWSWQTLWSAGKRAALAIILPVLLVGGIAAGAFTATEGGVIIVVYALAVSSLIYRELPLRAIGPVLVRASVLTGVLMLLVAMASSFAWVLAYTQVPAKLLNAITALTESPTIVLILCVLLLLVIGTTIETLAAMLITVPILFPLGEAMGYHPIHFGMVIIIALLVGTITPPVGILLYVCAGIAEVDAGRAFRAIAPFALVMVIALLLVALVPGMTLWLPTAG